MQVLSRSTVSGIRAVTRSVPLRPFTTLSPRFNGTINNQRFFSADAKRGELTKEQIMKGESVPVISPSYPRGPYRFIDREYLIVAYETSREELRKVVPEPLVPNEKNIVLYEWINMPDSSGGFGSYCESGAVIPCTYNGEEVNFVLEMYLNCEPPIAGGREIWGFPKKRGEPSMKVTGDTWTGVLHYANQKVAMGTMNYKYKRINKDDAVKALGKKQVNLKIIPDVNWSPKIAQLVSYRLCDIDLKEAWEGPARLHLVPHINCPPADLPVKRIIGGKYYLADITLPYGEVMHDYLAPTNKETPKDNGGFTVSQILNTTSMPAVSPSYRKGPSHMQDREYLLIKYQSDPEIIRKYIPDLLVPNPENEVIIEWVKTNSTGLGAYTKCSALVPCKYIDKNGKEKDCDFLVQSYVDLESPITAGREVWGQPHKFGLPKLETTSDTVSAELKYAGEQVAVGSMVFKSNRTQNHIASQLLGRPQVNLKFIPNVDGDAKIAQLVAIHHEDIVVKEAWSGEARLSLIPHVNAPLADFPMVGNSGTGYHFFVDMVLPAGEVLHDYMK